MSAVARVGAGTGPSGRLPTHQSGVAVLIGDHSTASAHGARCGALGERANCAARARAKPARGTGAAAPNTPKRLSVPNCHRQPPASAVSTHEPAAERRSDAASATTVICGATGQPNVPLLPAGSMNGLGSDARAKRPRGAAPSSRSGSAKASCGPRSIALCAMTATARDRARPRAKAATARESIAIECGQRTGSP